MSASKEGYTRGGRAAYADVSPRHRCPVCGSDSWCQVARDGGAALCKRVESEMARTTRDGVPFWVHRFDSGTMPVRELPLEASVATAAPGVLDGAYRTVLAELDLSNAHRAGLRARGLSDAAIEANGYRTLPLDGRARLARAVVGSVGSHAAGVPGYYTAEADGRTWASFGGPPGLLVPVRDAAGKIVALKVRRDEAEDGQRYRYVSSAHRGGASAPTAVHVPRWDGARDVVRVTEGELKADVCTALSGLLTISAPGVGLWAKTRPVLHAWGTRRVRIAFDADCRVNAHVARALAACATALRADGLEVRVESWDPAVAKGMDDLLLVRARARGEIAA